MNIEPKYVTFEQAKLLKEKRFTQKSKYHYPNLSDKQEICLPTDWNNFTDMGFNSDYYTAPEQWQVVEWLRVNHGIWIIVEGDSYGDYWYVKLTVCSEEVYEDLDKRHGIISAHRKFNNEHNSPQEAYSAAFDYILKELI